jgi:hypothetical protein
MRHACSSCYVIEAPSDGCRGRREVVRCRVVQVFVCDHKLSACESQLFSFMVAASTPGNMFEVVVHGPSSL